MIVATLDKWATYRDVLVGEAINHPGFEQHQRVATNKCVSLDKKLGVAYCTGDEVWQLGQPGHLGMYVDPITRKFF